VATNPQTKPIDLGCESAGNWQLLFTPTVAIVIITQPVSFNPQVDKTLEFVTYGQCNARPTVTFPATGHQRLSTGTKSHSLMTKARVCEQLALKDKWSNCHTVKGGRHTPDRLSVRSALFPTRTIRTSRPRSDRTSSIQ